MKHTEKNVLKSSLCCPEKSLFLLPDEQFTLGGSSQSHSDCPRTKYKEAESGKDVLLPALPTLCLVPALMAHPLLDLLVHLSLSHLLLISGQYDITFYFFMLPKGFEDLKLCVSGSFTGC